MRRSAVTKQTRYLLAGKLEVSLRYGKSNMINYTISLNFSTIAGEAGAKVAQAVQ